MNLEAFYTVKSKNLETGNIKTLHTQRNLITDYGLNYFGSGSTTKTSKSAWSLNNCAIWMQDFDEPTVQLEELIVPYKSGIPLLDIRTKFLHNVGDSGWSPQYSVYGFDDGLTCYSEQTRTYTFPHKYIVGDMYGIYLGCFDEFGDYAYFPQNDPRVYPWTYQANSNSSTYTKDHVFSIFSAIKFKDPVTKLPKSIPVAEIEQIFIEYTLRRYLPKYTKPKVYKMTSSMNTEHTVTVQPKWDTSTYFNPTQDVNNYRSPFAKFDTYYQYMDVPTNQVHYSDGTSESFYDHTSNFSRSVLPYKNNSYRQGCRYYYDLNAANKKIKNITVGCNMGTMHVTFDPPIEKTIERKFNFALEWNWATGDVLQISRDPLAVSNSMFDIDLSDWILEEPTGIIRNELNAVPALYLSGVNKTNTFSQDIDLSEHILTNRRLTILWDSAKKGSSVQELLLEYKDENDLVIHTQNVTNIFSEDSLTFKRSYSQFMIDALAVTGQKVNVKFKLKTGAPADSFIAVNNIQMYITNMTPIEV